MENHINVIKRREFLKSSAKVTAATMLMGIGSSKLFAFSFAPLKNSVPAVTLNNGILMPRLGFGTNTLKGAMGTQSVSDAISVGYRLIDTAHIYGNEEAVGEGIKQSGIDRKELFITSKLWVDFAGYESTKKAFETSINKLGTEYLDLYLIHRPRGDVKGTWLAMEELYKAGKIRAIGVSNFLPDQLNDMMEYAKITPAINQIETHVFFQENNSYEFLKNSETQMEAWSPFAAGRNGIFENQTLAEIGKKYNKSNAQVSLRWHYQRGVVAIPRSSQKAHMIENLDIFNFELSETDMKTIATLDLNKTQFPEWG
ncbi:MAG: 2,5-diketo-D-gluconic acid reductase [Flavobacteriaceae bacterium CG_4_10_14_3_um_filter_33_47]|nr:MAG: 2,5-diketo-D-gluconic acid reductase [Flavobacteriaceae bacterium CG_4_10_14_3_um_filter_33_47]PJB20573.1 MAG: 2,5-diketo-D-gluconic acid reductase [Flavobacteriaceae bacterium CG_4_9_14_3_um_filter_33_16]